VVEPTVHEHKRWLVFLAIIPKLQLQPVRVEEVRNRFHEIAIVTVRHMMRLVKRLHTWAGLLTFVNLLVYGMAGLAATARTNPNNRTIGLTRRYEVAFTAPANATDRQLAELICDVLGLTLAKPVQGPAIQRDAANNLLLDLYHVNGHHRVTVLEKENRLQVEEFRAGVGRYADVLHMTTAVFRSGDRRMNVWAWYNEFAMWSLLGMTGSGLFLWLATRPRLLAAWISLGLGTAACGLVYVLVR
jgi:hypothetical protein